MPDDATPARLYGLAVRALERGSESERVPPCIVCGGQRAHARFEVEGFASRVVICAGCGLGRLHPLPSPEEVRAFYPDEYYGGPGSKFQSAIERLVRWVGVRHLSFLTAGLPRGSRVLDVGCGRGVLLGALADRGFRAHGVEISAEAVRGADPRAEIRIAPHLRDVAYPERSFDQVVIWHVLEHVHDPRGTLDEVARILRPGGRLVVAVPNLASLQARWSGAAWFHLDLPRHLYHFPLAALRRLLDDAGFEVEAEHHFSLRQNPFGWIQSFLNRSPRQPRNALYVMLQKRRPGDEPPFDARLRRRMWLMLALCAPVALALTGVETLLRSGGTVHLVARRRDGGVPR